MKKEAKEIGHSNRVMTYKNINTRVVKLFNAGFIEEVEQTGRPPHGRIDYKVNMKGLEQLVPDISARPDEVDNIIRYIDNTGLDKIIFQDLLTDRAISTLEVLDKYLNTNVAPLTDYRSDRLIKSLIETRSQIDRLDKALGYGPERFRFKTASKQLETTTSDSLEVAKEIRQVIDRHNKKYDKQGADPIHGTDPYAQELLDELDKSIKKYRPEISDEKELREMERPLKPIPRSGDTPEIKKYIEELINKEYVRYNPKSKQYNVTEKGKKHIESTRLQLLELFFKTKAHTNEVDERINKISKELESRTKSYNRIDKMLIETTTGRKKKPT